MQTANTLITAAPIENQIQFAAAVVISLGQYTQKPSWSTRKRILRYDVRFNRCRDENALSGANDGVWGIEYSALHPAQLNYKH